MKKIIFLLMAAMPLFFVGCDNDDDADNNTSPNTEIDLVTMDNMQKNTKYSLLLDSKERMAIEESDVKPLPSDGQRMIAQYEFLPNTLENNETYPVHLLAIREILTKNMEEFDPETAEDTYGNDSLKVEDIWIGGEYMNVKFSYMGESKTHFIHLIQDISQEYEDGNIHLELRHNADEDQQNVSLKGMACFNIKDLLPEEETVTFIIHAKESAESIELYEIEYDPASISKDEREYELSEETGDIK